MQPPQEQAHRGGLRFALQENEVQHQQQLPHGSVDASALHGRFPEVTAKLGEGNRQHNWNFRCANGQLVSSLAPRAGQQAAGLEPEGVMYCAGLHRHDVPLPPARSSRQKVLKQAPPRGRQNQARGDADAQTTATSRAVSCPRLGRRDQQEVHRQRQETGHTVAWQGRLAHC